MTTCTYVLLSVLALSHFVLSFLVKKKKKLSISVCSVLVLCSSLESSFFTWYQSLVQAREAKGQGTGVCRQLGLHGKTTPDEDGLFTTLVECVELNFSGQNFVPGAFRPPFVSRRLFLQVFCRCSSDLIWSPKVQYTVIYCTSTVVVCKLIVDTR